MHQLHFDAIGTPWHIEVVDEVDSDTWHAITQRIQERIAEFDATYSRFRGDSLVSRMSKTAGTYPLPADGAALLDHYYKLYAATDGRVTPLIGQAVSDAGYDASYSLIAKPLQKIPDWETVISYNEQTISVSQPALLDFGAAGKGYLVDIVSDLVHEAGVRSYSINASGDILHRSTTNQSLTIGLENPADTSEAIGVTHIANQSLCASAGNKRAWGDYTHIIDPGTLQSPTGIMATWVIAADTMTADGLATALFFTPANTLRNQFTFAYAIQDNSGGLQFSKNFPITLFEGA